MLTAFRRIVSGFFKFALVVIIGVAMLHTAGSPPAKAQNVGSDKKAARTDPRENCSENAKRLCDEAWAAQPQDVSTNDQDPEKAADLYREALKDSPRCRLALGMLSSLLQRDGKAKEAYDYNEILLGFYPNDSAALLAKANLLSYWKKDYQQALRIANDVLALDGPGNGYLNYLVAEIYSLMDNRDDSLKNLKLAMSINPDWGDSGNAQDNEGFKNLREDPRFWELVKKPAE